MKECCSWSEEEGKEEEDDGEEQENEGSGAVLGVERFCVLCMQGFNLYDLLQYFVDTHLIPCCIPVAIELNLGRFTGPIQS